MRLHYRIPKAWFALLIFSSFALRALAEDSKLPEDTSQLLGKLRSFTTEETLASDVKIEKAESSALAILAKHQEQEAELGNLDGVLALRKIKKLSEESKLDPAIPVESKAIIDKFLDYAVAIQATLEQEIAEKRKAVLPLLVKQVDEQTKQGNIDMAEAVRSEIEKLKTEMLPYSQRDLVEALLNYKWGWGSRGSRGGSLRLQFNEEGRVWHRAMRGKWSVVAERQVLISPSGGHRKVLMQFDENLTKWFEVDGKASGIRREAQKERK